MDCPRRENGTNGTVNKKKMGRIEVFSLKTIVGVIRRLSDVKEARRSLLSAVGAELDVSGKVRKVVKREEQCKLVVEPGDVPGFVVFADCISDAAAVVWAVAF